MSKEIMDYYEEIHQEQYEPLSDEHIVALFIKYRETRDETIRNELITHNLRLVCNVVRKYRGTCDSDPNSIKDIFQAGRRFRYLFRQVLIMVRASAFVKKENRVSMADQEVIYW